MVEPLHAQVAHLLFNVTWQSAQNVDMSFHCQVRMSVLIPIIESILNPLSISTISYEHNSHIFSLNIKLTIS